MNRRNVLQWIGGIGLLSTLGIETAGADESEGSVDKSEDDDNGSERFQEYDGDTTALPSNFGGYDAFLLYLAEGVQKNPGTPRKAAKGAKEMFQPELMQRDEETIEANKLAAKDFFKQRFGLQFETPENEGLFGIDIAQHNEGTAVMVPTFLNPEVAYTNMMQSGKHWPNHEELPQDPQAPGKVRDGGWWVTVLDTMTDLDGTYWSEEVPRLHREPVDPTLTGGDTATAHVHDGQVEIHGSLNEPGTTDLFFGDYNIKRGEKEDPIVINYKSTHPLDFNGNVPFTYVCDLHSHQLGGVGRVHGVAIPPQEDEQGNPVTVLRNVLTFPPEKNTAREAVVFEDKYKFQSLTDGPDATSQWV